jgi:hypothetical protein
MRNAYKYVGPKKPKGRNHPADLRNRGKDNIKMDLKETGWVGGLDSCRSG